MRATVTVLAFVNTDIAASFSAITWMSIEWRISKKPKFLGLLTGCISGLATITPCAGYVNTWAAVIIGVVAGATCYLSVWLKNKMKWDDSLDVWGVHGMGGIAGTVMLGLFATKSVNAAGANGLFYGGWAFFGKQLVAVVFAGCYGFCFTFAMLKLLDRVLPGGVRVSDSEQEDIDKNQFSEDAYASTPSSPKQCALKTTTESIPTTSTTSTTATSTPPTTQSDGERQYLLSPSHSQ